MPSNVAVLGELGVIPAGSYNPLPLLKRGSALRYGLRDLRDAMDGGVSGINFSTQNALHPLHGMSVNVDEAGQNCVSVQVEQPGTGTGASCECVAVAEGEDSAVPYGHGAHHTS